MPRNRLSDYLRRVSSEEKETKTVEREKRLPVPCREIRILREKLGRIEERRFPFMHLINDLYSCVTLTVSSLLLLLLLSRFSCFFSFFILRLRLRVPSIESKTFCDSSIKYATKSRHDLSDCYKTYGGPSS